MSNTLKTPQQEINDKGNLNKDRTKSKESQEPRASKKQRLDLTGLGYEQQIARLSPRGGGEEQNQSNIPASITATDMEFILAWNSKADITKILAFSTPGITAFGATLLAQIATGGPDALKGYPNLTEEQWKWIRETGHPFAIGNYWEENSQGKPLVFTNIYGHGTLGIINMTVADALFPNSPLLALVAASIMYTNFELFGEGSIKARYEPNDFFISNVIPMLGSQAVADMFHLKEKIPPSIVASAQSLVYALCSGKKMTKTDYLALAGYPVLWRLFELSPLFKGKSALLDSAFEHIGTTFGFSQGIGPYTGLAYTGKIKDMDVTAGIGFGPQGQRANLSVSGEGFGANAYVERQYDKEGGTDFRAGINISVALQGSSKKEIDVARNALRKDITYSINSLERRTTDKKTKERMKEIGKSLLKKVDKVTSTQEIARLRGDLRDIIANNPENDVPLTTLMRLESLCY